MTNEGAGPPATYGLILAGGLARRMGGGDKTLIRVGEKTILERAIAALAPQCAGLLINANGDVSRFSGFGIPIIADDIAGFAGPLAGILAGLEWVAANAPASQWVLSVPGDCPFLPRDLVSRLHAARVAERRPLACAKSGEWRHPVVGLWRIGLRDDLRQALGAGLRKIEAWTEKHGVALAEWPAEPVDPFFNVNTPEDAAEAERMAQMGA
jgi:molybdopterin-guanine dinucleotide biosynthesis protein A